MALDGELREVGLAAFALVLRGGGVPLLHIILYSLSPEAAFSDHLTYRVLIERVSRQVECKMQFLLQIAQSFNHNSVIGKVFFHKVKVALFDYGLSPLGSQFRSIMVSSIIDYLFN